MSKPCTSKCVIVLGFCRSFEAKPEQPLERDVKGEVRHVCANCVKFKTNGYKEIEKA